jgi:hypothetical protein
MTVLGRYSAALHASVYQPRPHRGLCISPLHSLTSQHLAVCTCTSTVPFIPTKTITYTSRPTRRCSLSPTCPSCFLQYEYCALRIHSPSIHISQFAPGTLRSSAILHALTNSKERKICSTQLGPDTYCTITVTSTPGQSAFSLLICSHYWNGQREPSKLRTRTV